MAIYKSVQYSIFCENWQDCNQFEDYCELPHEDKKAPQRYFRRLGYKKVHDIWYCNRCARKAKRQPNKTNHSNERQ